MKLFGTLLFITVALLLSPVASAQGSVKYDGSQKGLSYPDIEILIDEPQTMIPGARTEIILYALPNGTLIDWIAGRKMQPGDYWHYDAHHIAAQTAFLRARDRKCNYVTIYLKARQKSWKYWHRDHTDICKETYDSLFADVVSLYSGYNPTLTISSHSGGGYLIFNYFSVTDNINPAIKHLIFLDSVYGYSTDEHLCKFTRWLEDKSHSLSVIGYEDATVIFRGAPLVTPSGGGWGRSHQMISDLGGHFRIREKVRFVRDGGDSCPEIRSPERKFSDETDVSDNAYLECWRSESGRISFKLLRNPDGLIWHLVLVEKNGFIDSVLTGTSGEGKGYRFWGPRAYSKYIL